MPKKHLLYVSIGCLVFLITYPPTRLYFLSDDFDSLFLSLQPATILHSFRPVADATLFADYSIWKMNAAGFHLTNILLHFACVFCFYLLAKKLSEFACSAQSPATLALVASLLFLFYPFHSEALFWIVGRGAVLCTLFSMLSILFYLHSNKNLYYGLALASFALALLSYEEAWILPLIISLFTMVFNKNAGKNKWLFVGGFWLLFLLYLAGRYHFTKAMIGTPYGSERMVAISLSLWTKNLVALVCRCLVVPMQSSALFVAVSATVLALLALVVFWVRKEVSWRLFIPLLLFIISLLPVIPLGIDTHDTESERFLYFPSLFILLFLVQLAASLPLKKTVLFVVLMAEGAILWVSYNSFAASSRVSKATISLLQKMPPADTIFCTNLPGQYKGAFIFRNGFGSAMQLATGHTDERIVVQSTSELFNPAKNYRAGFGFSLPDRKKTTAITINWTEDKVEMTLQK